jgi:hypothetical protein
MAEESVKQDQTKGEMEEKTTKGESPKESPIKRKRPIPAEETKGKESATKTTASGLTHGPKGSKLRKQQSKKKTQEAGGDTKKDEKDKKATGKRTKTKEYNLKSYIKNLAKDLAPDFSWESGTIGCLNTFAYRFLERMFVGGGVLVRSNDQVTLKTKALSCAVELIFYKGTESACLIASLKGAGEEAVRAYKANSDNIINNDKHNSDKHKNAS